MISAMYSIISDFSAGEDLNPYRRHINERLYPVYLWGTLFILVTGRVFLGA